MVAGPQWRWVMFACGVAFACGGDDPNRAAGGSGASSAAGSGVSGSGAGGTAGASGASGLSGTSGAAGASGAGGIGGGTAGAGASGQGGRSGQPGTATCDPPMPSGEGVVFMCDGQPEMQTDGLCTIVDDNGMSWTYPPLCGAQVEAKPVCDGLTLDGHDDWRLATIDDLRTVVVGCPSTATGGRCGVTNQCTSVESCWTSTDCSTCASAGTTACKPPFANFGAMLSDTATPMVTTRWLLDCTMGAAIIQAAPGAPGPFQCVR